MFHLWIGLSSISLLLLSTFPVHAQAPGAKTELPLAYFVDGNTLYRTCSDRSPVSQAQCYRYVIGAADMISFYVYRREERACWPNGITAEQVVDVVKNYLNNRPQDRHLPASSVISVSLANAFCN